MMSFREYAKNIQNTGLTNIFSCIPQQLSVTPFEFGKGILQQNLIIGKSINKITIIDPYISESDLALLADIYGGRSNILLEVISKFDVYSPERSKENTIAGIKRLVRYLSSSGLFASVVLLKSEEQMHDRYVISWLNDDVMSIALIGGSISQKFSDNTAIIEIKGAFMENCILKYIEALRNKACDIK